MEISTFELEIIRKQEIIDTINQYKRNREYEKIDKILEKELLNISKDREYLQFLLWHQGICDYYIRNQREGLLKLKSALSLRINKSRDNLFTEREIEIMISYANIEFDDKNYQKAYDYFQYIHQQLNGLNRVKDFKVVLKVLFGLALSAEKVGELEASITYSELGIEECLKNESFYALGELFFQAGESNYKLGNRDKGIEYMQKSYHTFKLQKNEIMAEIAKRELENTLLNDMI